MGWEEERKKGKKKKEVRVSQDNLDNPKFLTTLAISVPHFGQGAKRISWKILRIVSPRNFKVQIRQSLVMTSRTTALTVHLYN